MANLDQKSHYERRDKINRYCSEISAGEGNMSETLCKLREVYDFGLFCYQSGKELESLYLYRFILDTIVANDMREKPYRAIARMAFRQVLNFQSCDDDYAWELSRSICSRYEDFDFADTSIEASL